MTDPKLEQQARELLATACGERVEDMLYDRPGSVAKDQAIRAIVAALSQQRAVPESFVDKVKAAHRATHPVARDTLLSEAVAMLAAAPSPEQENGNG